MKFKLINDVSGPRSHTMVSKMQDWRVKNRNENSNVVYATKKETFDDEPALTTPMAPVTPPSSVPPPGRVDGFSPYGRGHSPGIGHSIQD
uniref:Uncharacterized protein n=1 Tax=Solanum tuberosum TaxID=4113 RepID=M1BQZ3_SOLTU